MSNLIIRPATIADLPEIMCLERAGFDAAIQESEATFVDRIRTFPEGCLVLANEAGELSGYLCAELWPYSPEIAADRFARNHSAASTHHPAGDEIYISSMVIDAVSRGSGLAKRLFSESLARIGLHFPAVRSAILIVHPDWHGAVRIYRAAGFEEIGIVEKYFATTGGHAHAATIMRRAR